MLKIIHGESGTGKSTLLYKKISEYAESGRQVLLFVPDQFSFEAEKIIYRTVPHKFSQNVRVTMFSREAQHILEKYGETKDYADDIAKKVLMIRALRTAAADGGLEYYKSQYSRQGFADFALRIVSDIRAAGLSPSELRGIALSDSGFSETLTKKMNDICLFYDEYDKLLSINYRDRLDDIRRAAQLAAETDDYKDTFCFFDGFDSFSGNQMNFIGSLLGKTAECVFALTSDTEENGSRKFLAAHQLIGKLKGMSDGNFELIPMKEKYRSFSEIYVTEAGDMWRECDWICAEIRRLTDEGMRYRDIVVLTPESTYAQILGSSMKKYDIPCFDDIPEPLITKSFVRFSLYALRALSFETDDILRYIKSGFVRTDKKRTIKNTDIDRLERLCRRYDIRRRDWLRPFPEKLEDCEKAEALREAIIIPLKELRDKLADADGDKMTEALCDFIFNKMDINSTVYGKCRIGTDDSGKPVIDSRLMDEYSSVWDDAMTVFESAHKSLSGYRMSIPEFTDILSTVFSSTTIAKPPQVLDAVTIGDTERSRPARTKAVFLCGFSSGLVPRPIKFSDAFTGGEGEILAAHGIPLGPDRATRYSSELFGVYRCVNLPEEKLYITYPLLDAKFSAAEPSPLLKEIAEQYGAEIKGADDFGADFYCRTEKAAKRYLADIYHDYTKFSERRAVAARLDGEWCEMLRNSSGEKQNTERHLITKEHAENLLSLRTYSPSAFGRLNNCKFSYFCRYGLHIKPDDERDINAMLCGNVTHFCLFRLLDGYKDRPDDFRALSEEEISAHIKESIGIYEKEKFFGEFGSSKRFSYLLERLSRIVLRVALRIHEEISASGFYPVGLEKEVEFRFGDIIIKGICDRVDEMTKDGKKYLRVIDYKHGQKEIKLSSVYKGENLQMMLYLFGLCELENALPSSVMYSLIGKPELLNSSSLDAAEAAADAQKQYLVKHLPTGVIVSSSPETEELAEREAQLTEKYAKKKTGYITVEKVSSEEFEAIKKYCRGYVNFKIEEVMNGMISACPKTEEACGYCDYSLFCGRKEEEEDE